MQPDRDETDWQQPASQAGQAPYAVSPETTEAQPAPTEPIVTLAPEGEAPQNEPLQSQATPDVAPEHQPVRWDAHEYIHREKNVGWFIVFGLVVLLLIAAAIFIIKSVTFAILIPVMAAALIVYNNRPPRVLNYTLSRQGLHVNDTLYPFADFKGFGVIKGDDEYSIMLIPTKRFKPGVSVYFPEEAGEAIVDMLAARLPMQELHLDFIDRVVRKLRI